MPTLCDYCRGPIIGEPIVGRAFESQPAGQYCCYGCLNLGEQEQDGPRPRLAGFRLDGTTIRLGLAILIAGQSMIFGLAISLSPPDPITHRIVTASILLATLLVMAILGGPLIRVALAELRQHRITIEALFVLTLAGAFIASTQSLIRGTGPIYYEVVSVVLIVYSLGKWIGAKSRATALAATQAWQRQLAEARRIDHRGQTMVIPITDIRSDDLVQVRPGEMIPVDGIITHGCGFVLEAAVNGEPFVSVRRPGDAVLAATISQDATLHIRARSAGQSRIIDDVLRSIEAARERPISLQALADRLSRVFLPLIVGVALLTFISWCYFADASTALFHSMSVLLVACPCALGLATPVLVWTAIQRLAERGIMVQAGDAIERLAQVDTIVFDKTGTLTEEQFGLLDISTIAQGEERTRWLGWLAKVQEQSPHPMARPFESLGERSTATITDLSIEPGCGIRAALLDDGAMHTIRIGRADWIVGDAQRANHLLGQMLTQDGHRIDCEIDGELAAIAMVRERLREAVPDTLRQLPNMGLRVRVLTGDRSDRAERLNLPDVEIGLSPADKHARIVAMQASGARVLMVGDGINDASSLSSAHVGMALSSGTALAVHSAALTLYHHDLRIIPWAIALARNTIRQVRWNLLMAAGYNVIGITLAALGFLHPITAALLMVVSSLFVIASSTRLRVAPHECGCPSPITAASTDDRATLRAAAHALGILVQGGLAHALFGLALSDAAFLVMVGLMLTWGWQHWATIPHHLDMAFGMLTVGNAGMLLGWWVDAGFTTLPAGRCECCLDALRAGRFHVGMWLGMLIGCNVAMGRLLRHPAPGTCHTIAMFTGGNVGMMIGMIAGGAMWTTSTIGAFLGMTTGMMIGMFIGTWVATWVATKVQNRPIIVPLNR